MITVHGLGYTAPELRPDQLPHQCDEGGTRVECQITIPQLVALLNTYGEHHPTCGGDGACDCGWEEKRREIEQANP